MSTTIYCDHCGQPCGAPLRPERWRCDLRLPKMSVRVDLCGPCQDELHAFIGRRERYYAASVPASAPGIQNAPESGDPFSTGSSTSGDVPEGNDGVPGAVPSPATESALTAEPMNPAGSGAPDADSVPAKRPV